MSKRPPPAPTVSAVGPYPTVIQTVGRPGTTGSGKQENSLPHELSRWLLHSLIKALQALHDAPPLPLHQAK